MNKILLIVMLISNGLVFSQIEIEKNAQISFSQKEIIETSNNEIFIKTVSLSNTDNQPFITLSIRLNGNFILDNEVQIRTFDNKWNHWQSLKEDIHQKQENIIFKNLLFIEANVKEIELKFSSIENIEDIKLSFFYPGFTDETSGQNNEGETFATPPPPPNCSCPIPNYEERLDWCPTGNCPFSSSPTATTVTHLIVHHQGAAASTTSSDWAAKVRGIWNYHVNDRGWSDIGYNYLIAPNGVIFEGRGDNVLGAHFSGMNGGTMGVCLLGDYHPGSGNGIPSSALIGSLEELLAWKECDISKDPLLSSYHTASSQNLVHIAGHRDSGSGTECPGDNVYNLLPDIRNTTSTFMQNCSFVVEADLVVSSLSTSPSNIIVYENTSILLAVGNGGSEDVNDSIKVVLTIEGDTIETFIIDTIQGSEIINFSFPNYVFTNTGNHNICVYIDTAINETSTLNNSYCKTVNVIELNSNIVIQSIEKNILNPEAGQTVALDFKIKNIGDTSTLETIQSEIKIEGQSMLTYTVSELDVSEVHSKIYNHIFATAGNYQVCVYAESPTNEISSSNNSYCKNIYIKNKTIETTGIENIDDFKKIKVYPNPAKKHINIEIELEEKTTIKYTLFNDLGQKIISKQSKNSKIHKERINVNNLSRGIYYLEISSKNNLTKQKIVINK